jgi:glutathione S-transferase
MMVFSLTTMGSFVPVAPAPSPAILTYLQRIGSREGYRRAMEMGNPGVAPMLT